jgi:hypothetical protein
MSKVANIGGNQFRNFKTELGFKIYHFVNRSNQGLSNFTGGLDSGHYNNSIKRVIREFKK